MKNFISLKNIDNNELLNIFKFIDEGKFIDLGKKVMGVAFFQSSTRTRLSFERAMISLGGKVIGFSNMNDSRCYDNYFQESFEDFVQVISEMIDVLVIRHFKNYILNDIVELIDVPIINAGDGLNEHPVQALQDIWMMIKKSKRLYIFQKKTIAFVGNISRNFRSMIFALGSIHVKKIIFLFPLDSSFPNDIKKFIDANIEYEFYSNISDVLADADFVHTFAPSLEEMERREKNNIKPFMIKKEFIVDYQTYKQANSNAYIFNAGPRTYEVSSDMDNHPKFLFLNQVKEGIMVKKALLSYLFSYNFHYQNISEECNEKIFIE